MKRLILASLALALSACAGMSTPPSTPPGPSVAVTSDKLVLPAAVDAVATTAATLADAVQVAPPATLTARVSIDDVLIRRAFVSFDQVLTIIDAARDSGLLRPGTPLALTIQQRGRQVQAALNAASAAQRVQSAGSYRDALERAEVALTRFNALLSR